MTAFEQVEDFLTFSSLISICIATSLVYWIMSLSSSSKKDTFINDPKAFLQYQPYEPPATLWSDLKVIKAMWFAKITGTDLQERLDSFYENQADLYDSYRFRMLHGRPKMLQGVARHVSPSTSTDGIVWVDLACGTGANVENFGKSVREGKISRVYLVDLCQPLCKVAKRERGEKYGSNVVKVLHGDVTNFELEGLPPANSVDLVTISYSLVMIPAWEKCIQNAKRLLKPGGVIGVTDFTVAPDQSNLSQKFWKDTFAKDHVFLDAEHLNALKREFEEVEAAHDYGTLPYTPFFLKAAYYHFIGKKK
mmetsp:Transcript_14485/g.22359  ORF Transcript_14485/g.22359 Transcript_14485/m.22359 type:complete len:307 (+) Transcript_14485:52-972(+)